MPIYDASKVDTTNKSVVIIPHSTKDSISNIGYIVMSTKIDDINYAKYTHYVSYDGSLT